MNRRKRENLLLLSRRICSSCGNEDYGTCNSCEYHVAIMELMENDSK